MRVSSWVAGTLGLVLAPVLLLLGTEYAVARASHRTANVAYVAATAPDFAAERHLLDVYAPRPAGQPRPVVVFIHGGSWNSGNKNFYGFIGRRLARQGMVAVVINYRLAPQVQVPAMAHDCARAVQWTQQHIADFGGDPNRIFLMGHSAGGGLAALLATNNELFARLGETRNPVRGVVLDDAAGLNMNTYLQKQQYPGDEQYLIPFGPDSAQWRQVSPYYFLGPQSPPFLQFVGSETYPGILHSNQEFRRRLLALGHPSAYTLMPGKKHVPMVLQLYFGNNLIYRKLRALVAEPAAARR